MLTPERVFYADIICYAAVVVVGIYYIGVRYSISQMDKKKMFTIVTKSRFTKK